MESDLKRARLVYFVEGDIDSNTPDSGRGRWIGSTNWSIVDTPRRLPSGLGSIWSAQRLHLYVYARIYMYSYVFECI